MLDFLSVCLKSPIVYEKLLFSKPSKSDWMKALVFITKKHLKRCYLKNGARYCAVIGLRIMRILRNWEEKLRQFKILINHCQTVVFKIFIVNRITIVFFIFYNCQTKLFFSLILYAVTIYRMILFPAQTKIFKVIILYIMTIIPKTLR